MGEEIGVGATAAKVVIHHRSHARADAACGAPPGTPWTRIWEYVRCEGCKARQPGSAPPPAR